MGNYIDELMLRFCNTDVSEERSTLVITINYYLLVKLTLAVETTPQFELRQEMRIRPITKDYR